MRTRVIAFFRQALLTVAVVSGTAVVFYALGQVFALPEGMRGSGSPTGGVRLVGQMLVDSIGVDGNDSDIFVVDPLTHSVEQLSLNAGMDSAPSWSPARDAIAFMSDRDQAGNVDLYVMAADGSNVRRITSDPAIDSGPDWSPDGTSIAFERTGPDGHPELYVVNLATLEELRLTTNDLVDIHPDWSPDGSKIAFTRNLQGNADIYFVSWKSGIETRLTEAPGADSGPVWSPDGSQIAFVRDEDEDSYADLYLMDVAGGAVERLTSANGDERGPDWSPDGSFLAYISRDPPLLPGEVELIGTGPTLEMVAAQGGVPTEITPVSGTTVDWN